MTGYREHSFDPNAYEQPGPPLKPYNWVQWTGVALGGVGIALIAIHFAGRAGLIPQWIEDPSPAPFMLMLIGIALINSRRGLATMVGSEQLEKNRKFLWIAIAICALGLAAALANDLLGAM